MIRIKLLHSYIAKLFKNKKQHNNITIQQSNKGFTLIELLVVISIIAILMAVATVSYLNAQQKGRDNKRKSDLKAVQQALEIYYNQKGKYPFQQTDTDSIAYRMACADTPGTAVKWGATFTCTSITYMNPLPKDPVFPANATNEYFYESPVGNATYTISANLENTKDPESKNVAGNQLPCTPKGWADVPSKHNYCVVNP